MSNLKDTEDFVARMHARLAHYKSNLTTTFGTQELISNARFASNEDLPDGLKRINAEVEVYLEEIATHVKNYGDQGIQDLKLAKDAGQSSEKAISNFKRRMEERKKKAKEEADEKIEEAFNKLIDYGERNPQHQPQVESLADQMAQYFSQLWLGTIIKFFEDVAEKIVSFFESAGDWLNKSVETVENWGKEAVKTITSWF